MLNIAEVIGKAREYMEKHGWITGEVKEGEKVCSYGALLMALDWMVEDGTNNIRADVDQNELTPVAEFLLVHGIGLEPNRDGVRLHMAIHQIVNWNDAEDRSEQEVLDAFAKAEKIAIAGFDPDA